MTPKRGCFGWDAERQSILEPARYSVGQKALEEMLPMTRPIHADPIPVRSDEHGTLRVGDSRVTLDVVIHEYEDGADPEGIVHAYPALRLADAYAAIAYYLRHKDEVSEYLRQREAEAAELRREIEAAQGPSDLRARLLARRDEREQTHASSGD
jgi:uncharacterized protein (DUF433 family)